jgi:expansin (peptidoglycan-binding protein)
MSMRKQLLIFSISLFCGGFIKAQSSCNATVYTGDGTFYIDAEAPGSASATFNCSFVNANIKPYYGAMNNTQYATADYCGTCVELTGKAGTKGTQIIEIVDKCPECLVGDIDLSNQAFLAIFGDLGIGRAKMDWHEVACPWSTTPVNITTQGCNQWYAKIIVAKHKNKINKVEIYDTYTSKWVNMTRGMDNGWVNATAISIPGKTNLRITDVFSQQITVVGFEIASGVATTFQGTSNFPPCLSTDIADYETVRNVNIYPNPAIDALVFDDIQGIKTINIFNLTGQLIRSESLSGGASKMQFSISNLAAGSYNVQLSNGTAIVYNGKFIKL